MIFVKWSCSVKKFCTLENSQKGHFSKIKIKKQPNRYQRQNEIEIEVYQTKVKSKSGRFFETDPPMKMHLCNSFVTHRAFQAPGPLVKKLQKYSPTKKNASSGRKENGIRKPLFFGP